MCSKCKVTSGETFNTTDFWLTLEALQENLPLNLLKWFIKEHIFRTLLKGGMIRCYCHSIKTNCHLLFFVIEWLFPSLKF